MLSLQKQPKYVRKTVKLPNGSLALVVFELIELNGKITAKAVYGELLSQEVAKSETLALPVYFETQHIAPVISPFFSEVKSFLKDLSFVITQPSRAPNF